MRQYAMFRRTTPPRSTTSSQNISSTAILNLSLSLDLRSPSTPFSKSDTTENLLWITFSIPTLWCVWSGPHILPLTGEAVRPRQRGRGGRQLLFSSLLEEQNPSVFPFCSFQTTPQQGKESEVYLFSPWKNSHLWKKTILAFLHIVPPLCF